MCVIEPALTVKTRKWSTPPDGVVGLSRLTVIVHFIKRSLVRFWVGRHFFGYFLRLKPMFSLSFFFLIKNTIRCRY